MKESNNKISRLMTEQHNSPWASAQSDQCQWVAKGPMLLHSDSEDSDAQADLSLRWTHILLVLSCGGLNVLSVTCDVENYHDLVDSVCCFDSGS